MKISVFLYVLMPLATYANSQLLSTVDLNSNVVLTAYPPFIVEALPFQVDIECLFKRNNMPNMASIMSMVIGHSNKTNQPVFNYLASVNGIEGNAHNVTHDVEVISGSIDNNGESKLHIRFRYPETHLFGLYMCEVTGFDQIGKPVSIYSTANVLKYNITYVVDLLHKAQSNLSAMQAFIHSQETYIESIHRLNSTLCSDYFPSIYYNRHDYYLSQRLSYFNYTEMQLKCEGFGGYLVELDTHEEFNFIRDYLFKLGNTSHTDFFWTGATDEEHEGVWINKHASTSRPSFDWSHGAPTINRVYNCQCLTNLELRDCVCYFNIYPLTKSRYICEIPRVTC